ncbi:CocE/NonD family hydrolase, partial [bacterium]|nr:CocE/NonD family hydrolase [bacterium]
MGVDHSPATGVDRSFPPEQATPPPLDILPALDELGEGITVKAASANFGLDLTVSNLVNDAALDGASVNLPSTAGQFSAMIYGFQLSYEVQPGDFRPVPFLAPYEMTIMTDGGGEFWIALADYGSGVWNILPDTFSGAEITLPVGLGPNAANTSGTFWFALIAYGGSNVTINGIDLEYPDIPFMGAPLDYHMFIEAADGTMLATNVYLPYEADLPIPPPPYPVVLFRTPYDKSQIDPAVIAQLVGANVVVIVQYFRGRLNDTGDWPDSGGTETLFRDHAGPDHTDALDTVDWIEGRQWYSGTLVMTGPSALGLWIYQAATQLGDRVDAIYPQISSGNVANWAALENGCFKRGNMESWITFSGFPPELLTEAENDFAGGQGWEELDFDSQAGGADTPGYHETGWWDVDVESTIHSWQELSANGGTLAAGNQWLIIGPWSHDTVRENVVGELTFPVTPAVNDPTTIPPGWDGLDWTSFKLGRNPTFPGEPAQRVLAYFIGEEGNTTGLNNTWMALDDWPASSNGLIYFIDPPNDMRDSPQADATDSFSCNPAEPLLNVGGANLPFGILAGPYDQSAVEAMPGVLQYLGGALSSPLAIAGPVRAVLHISTDAADTDIMVKLIDRYPGGPNMLVAD